MPQITTAADLGEAFRTTSKVCANDGRTNPSQGIDRFSRISSVSSGSHHCQSRSHGPPSQHRTLQERAMLKADRNRQNVILSDLCRPIHLLQMQPLPSPVGISGRNGVHGPVHGSPPAPWTHDPDMPQQAADHGRRASGLHLTGPCFFCSPVSERSPPEPCARPQAPVPYFHGRSQF